MIVQGKGAKRFGFGLVLAAAILGSAAPAFPWGCEGHQIIGLIAEKHLNAHARKMVHDLLASYQMPPSVHRSCRPTGHSLIADTSNWADDVRSDARTPYQHTGAWHFIDIPLGAQDGDLSRFCPSRNGCVTRAIKQQLGTLRGQPRGNAQGDRAAALMFVIHLIGDLHQPLHCADNHDEGGNCVPIIYFGIAPQPSDRGAYQPNLHAVWDTYLVRRLTGHRNATWFADMLEQRWQTKVSGWQQAPIDVDGWAWETHRVAVQTAYGKLPVAIPSPSASPVAARVDCRVVSERMLALHERLMQPYQDDAGPAAEEQLAKAGVRLAMVLNQLWP
jgi:nuclease S1